MQATTEQLQQISIFSDLELEQLAHLKPHTLVKTYLRGEIILHEGDLLPARLFSALSSTMQVKKTAYPLTSRLSPFTNYQLPITN
jgi:signal-transduction protein with cAMP-binding, CBS, and nucleotidyltransferase domain